MVRSGPSQSVIASEARSGAAWRISRARVSKPSFRPLRFPSLPPPSSFPSHVRAAQTEELHVLKLVSSVRCKYSAVHADRTSDDSRLFLFSA